MDVAAEWARRRWLAARRAADEAEAAWRAAEAAATAAWEQWGAVREVEADLVEPDTLLLVGVGGVVLAAGDTLTIAVGMSW